MRVAPFLWLFLSAVFLVFTSREQPWADAHVMYDTTQALVERGALDVHTEGGPKWFYATRGGKRYGVMPLGNVVALVPSYLLYKTLRARFPLAEKPLFNFTCHFAPSLMMAAACALFFLVCRRRGASVRGALGLTLTLAFGTTLFVYSRSTYAEAVQTLALVWLVERTLAQAEAPTTGGLGWLGCAAGLLINTKLVYALVLPPVAIYLVWRRRHALGELLRKLPLAVLMFGELLALLLWHNHLKTGSIFQSGYQSYQEGVFSGDFFPALYGFLFSTGKGVFLYAPPLVLGVLGLPTAWRRRRAETALLVSISLIVLAFNAKFRIWHADYCWGPRYLVPVMPLLLWLAFPWLPEALACGRVRLRRFALAALLASGVLVQGLGASLYWDHYIRVLIAVKEQTGASGWFTEHLSHGHFIPVFSPVRGHAWLLSHLLHNDPELDRDAPWKPVIAAPANLSDAWGRLRLDWWPLEFGSAPGTGPNLALLGGALLLWLTASTLLLRRSLTRAT
jgi:hypothetical protein